MPMYSYRCCACQHEDTEFKRMQDATPVGDCIVCPKCSSTAYQRLIDLPHTDMKEYETPIEMHSIAVNHPDDVREFKRRCPTVACSDDESDPMYGIPVARSRKQKLAALQAAGFVETN